MGLIKILDENVSNIIAAGEVVESPTSLVKELLENSLDASSKNIKIEIKNGGRSINISDDGLGMGKEDLLLCIERHATSKIRVKEDLFHLSSYGFRGEALSSICAVAKVKIMAKTEEMEKGNYITVLGNKITSLNEINMNKGVNIEIKELFFNTPARLKFLRKSTTEYSYIKDLVCQEALANPNTAISLYIEDKEVVRTSGSGLKNCIVEIFGRNILKNLIEFEMGFLGNSSISRATKDSIYVYINDRMVKSKIVEDAIMDSYYTKLSKGKYPFAIIFIEIDPKEVDVNVHPSKKIVKFSNETNIYELVKSKITEIMKKNDDLTARELKTEIFETNLEKNKPIFSQEKSEKIKLPLEIKERKPIVSFIETPFISKINENKSYEKNSNILKEECELGSKEKIEEKIDLENENIQLKVEKKEEKIEKKIESKKQNKELETIKIIEKTKPMESIHLKIIGQFLNSYIIVENNKTLELYDQHIVHERILYEKYKNEYYNQNIKSQGLLIPQRVFLEPLDMEILRQNLAILNKFGFEVEEFGKNEILVRTVPVFEFKDGVESLLREMLKELREYKNKDPRESIIISMSCKGAIKAGELLKPHEMESLIEKLHEIGEYTCPHGRPIILRLGIDEIEKKFKRK